MILETISAESVFSSGNVQDVLNAKQFCVAIVKFKIVGTRVIAAIGRLTF